MIKQLNQDIAVTNELRRFRKTIGSTQKTTNTYSWWEASFSVLCWFPKGISVKKIECFLLEEKLMEYRIPSTLLRNAARGILRNPIRREYKTLLPSLANECGLCCDPTHEKLIFYFRDCNIAYDVLIRERPNLKYFIHDIGITVVNKWKPKNFSLNIL